MSSLVDNKIVIQGSRDRTYWRVMSADRRWEHGDKTRLHGKKT